MGEMVPASAMNVPSRKITRSENIKRGANKRATARTNEKQIKQK